MAKVVTDVLLKDGTDETAFINDVTSNTEVDLKNRLPNTPTLVVLLVEESYLDTLRSHSSVESAQVDDKPTPPTVTYPSIPSKYTLSNKTLTGGENNDKTGTNFISYQHYYDTDIITTSDNLGKHSADDESRLAGVTYYSTYTGKHVDIVTLEGGDGIETDDDYGMYGASHPDFDDPDNTGTSRCIAMDWSGLSGNSNNQITHGSMFNAHAIGTCSVAGGIYGGFAKKSTFRTAYLGDGSSVSECLDAIKSWHNSKSVNGTTGLKNPTVLILEWHSPPTSNNYAIKIEDIDSVTDPTGGTTNRPGSGWGSDLTPFISRGMMPYQLKDPNDGVWHWVMPFPSQTQANYRASIKQCWDAGMVVIQGGGNAGGVYVKDSDSRWDGSYCTISGTKDIYTMDYNASDEQNDPCTITRGFTTTTKWYRFKVWGPHGLDKSIEVAAGQNSEKYPMLDSYTTRGPGIDIIGRGQRTWSSWPWSTFADGNKWGTFGGTSCAMPTVAGKAACMMEEYYTLNGAWPTPDQVKNMLISEARPYCIDVATIPNWASVPTASNTSIIPTECTDQTDPHLMIKGDSIGGTRPNGGWNFGELLGTPPRFAFWNTKAFNREHTYKERPTSGVLYPRPRKFDYPPQ